MYDHPVRITVDDDLRRSRLTVFFRLLLALPHIIWLLLWSVAAMVAGILNWFAVLITARSPRLFHRFLAAYVRYTTHVAAFLWLAANPFPGFVGDNTRYPVVVEIAEPERQRRLVTLFKIFLAVPALLIAAILGGGLTFGGGYGDLAAVAAFLGWFAALVKGSMPRGLRNVAVWSLGYGAQLSAYLFSLNDRYPNSDPNEHVHEPPPEHSVRLELEDDGRRSRLTVFFRLLLAIPHIVWLSLWGYAVYVAAFIGWLCALATGRLPEPLHRFSAAYVRSSAQLYAYLLLIANPFPGFVGESYPLQIAIDAPVPQNRLVTFFRIVLAIPAFLLAAVLGYLLFVIALLGWFAALTTGRMPTGLRNAGAAAIRYMAQTYSYVLLLTPQYPHSTPTLPARAEPEPEPEPEAEPYVPTRSRTRGGGLTNRAAALRALAFVVLGVGWATAAYALWQTRVPGGLDLPEVDLSIDPDVIERSERYERFFRIEFVAAQIVLIVVLVAYARWGVRFARESAAGRIGTGMLLGMIGLALVWISQVPFRLAEVWWDRRYDQTDAGYVETLFANWFQLGAEFLFICFALVIVMAIAGRFPRRWWIGAAGVFVGLATLFGFIFPYLSATEPLGRPDLEAAARVYAKQQGIDPVRVAVEDVTDFTNAPNAYAVGFGPSKRIVFWNTLLDGRFSDGEVKVVLAHELAHHSRNHIPESLGWYALFALPGAWLIALATRRRGGMANPAAVPLSLLVIVLLDLVSLPVYNAISRHMEQEADWVALETTHDPDSAAGLFRNFTVESLNDPDPPTWSYLLFDSHPSVEKRIAMAEAWRQRGR